MIQYAMNRSLVSRCKWATGQPISPIRIQSSPCSSFHTQRSLRSHVSSGQKKIKHETAKETNNACWNVVIITLFLVSISAELLTCSNSCFWPLGSRKKLVEIKIVDALSLSSKSKFKTSKSEMVRMDQSRHQILYDAVSTKHPNSHWWIQWMSVF